MEVEDSTPLVDVLSIGPPLEVWTLVEVEVPSAAVVSPDVSPVLVVVPDVESPVSLDAGAVVAGGVPVESEAVASLPDEQAVRRKRAVIVVCFKVVSLGRG